MTLGLPRTVGRAESSASFRRFALVAMATATSALVVGCGSSTPDTAKATALFRQLMEHHYDVAAGRCARNSETRWTCTARIDNVAKEIDVDVNAHVSRADGQWTESDSTTILGG